MWKFEVGRGLEEVAFSLFNCFLLLCPFPFTESHYFPLYSREVLMFVYPRTGSLITQ